MAYSTLISSCVIQVYVLLLALPPFFVRLEHAERVCWLSTTEEGGLRASGQGDVGRGLGGGWVLNKSRGWEEGGGWRDFSCPGHKESGPGPPSSTGLSRTSSTPSPPLPQHIPALPYPQHPTVMDDDMCHIKSTCIHRGSASSMLACFLAEQEV